MAEIRAIEEGIILKKWIQFDEDTEVLMKFIPKGELKKELRKAEKTARLTGGNVTDILNQNLAPKVVMGWRKTTDPEGHPGLTIKGKPFPFTPENLKFLMANSYEFVNFVTEYTTNAREFTEEEDAEEVKNS